MSAKVKLLKDQRLLLINEKHSCDWFSCSLEVLCCQFKITCQENWKQAKKIPIFTAESKYFSNATKKIWHQKLLESARHRIFMMRGSSSTSVFILMQSLLRAFLFSGAYLLVSHVTIDKKCLWLLKTKDNNIMLRISKSGHWEFYFLHQKIQNERQKMKISNFTFYATRSLIFKWFARAL